MLLYCRFILYLSKDMMCFLALFPCDGVIIWSRYSCGVVVRVLILLSMFVMGVFAYIMFSLFVYKLRRCSPCLEYLLKFQVFSSIVVCLSILASLDCMVSLSSFSCRYFVSLPPFHIDIPHCSIFAVCFVLRLGILVVMFHV